MSEVCSHRYLNQPVSEKVSRMMKYAVGRIEFMMSCMKSMVG